MTNTAASHPIVGARPQSRKCTAAFRASTLCRWWLSMLVRTLSYPLHRPGHPDELRVDHWRNVTCLVLLLSGDRDQFARIDLLQQSVRRFPRAELHIYAGARHGLQRVADNVAERISDFVMSL